MVFTTVLLFSKFGVSLYCVGDSVTTGKKKGRGVAEWNNMSSVSQFIPSYYLQVLVHIVHNINNNNNNNTTNINNQQSLRVRIYDIRYETRSQEEGRQDTISNGDIFS